MKPSSRRSNRLRQIRASLRDTWLLLREFGWPLAIFIFAIVGGGISYFYLSHTAGEAIENIPKALYLVLSLTFMQPSGDFPRTWYLEVFYFLMPLIGVIIFSHGIAEFGAMFFNRHQRSREWEMAVSSTFSNHHVLVGLGHLGYRVACYLHDLGQDVVVVELNPAADLVENVKKMGIPVIQDDAKREPTLVGAGIARARTIILCTQNDSLNLQVALTARRLNKEIHVLLRIFDEEFARALNEQFGFTALSATQMAAPVFASTAAGIEITHPITIEGKPLSLAQLKLTATSKFAEMSIASVEQKFDISVVLLRRNHQLDFHPAGHILLQAEDSLAILGGPAEIAQMAQENL